MAPIEGIEPSQTSQLGYRFRDGHITALSYRRILFLVLAPTVRLERTQAVSAWLPPSKRTRFHLRQIGKKAKSEPTVITQSARSILPRESPVYSMSRFFCCDKQKRFVCGNNNNIILPYPEKNEANRQHKAAGPLRFLKESLLSVYINRYSASRTFSERAAVFHGCGLCPYLWRRRRDSNPRGLSS